MNRVIGNRAERAERSKTRQIGADWMTAEEIGKHVNRSGDTVREKLCELGYGCKVSKKPTQDSFDKNLARMYRHKGKKKYKWSKKEILPIMVSSFKN